MPTPEEMGIPQEAMDFKAPADDAASIESTPETPTDTAGQAQEQAGAEQEQQTETNESTVELQKLIDIWDDNLKTDPVTPFGHRVQAFQREYLPVLVDLKMRLDKGESTFTDTHERPYRTGRPIMDRVNEITRDFGQLTRSG